MIIVLGYDKKLEGAIFFRCRWCTCFFLEHRPLPECMGHRTRPCCEVYVKELQKCVEQFSKDKALEE